MHSKSIEKLIKIFSNFPTIGPKTATRFVFYLLRLPKEEIEELTLAISSIKNNVKLCQLCFKSFESPKGSELCEICQDSRREKELLCIVEKEADLITLEKTKKYHGLYFILGGLIPVLKKKELKNIRVKELLKRANEPAVKEIIIALNPTTQGEATILYLERILKPLGKKITRLGRGLPLGAELEYSDDETLASALESRR